MSIEGFKEYLFHDDLFLTCSICMLLFQMEITSNIWYCDDVELVYIHECLVFTQFLE